LEWLEWLHQKRTELAPGNSNLPSGTRLDLGRNLLASCSA
jgi:hypothetical protein